MIPATSFDAQPSDWRRAYRDLVTDPHELLALLGLESLAGRLPAAGHAFPLRVPRGFVARMRPGDPEDPLLRQVLPLDAEYRPQPGFDLDAVGDLASREAPGVLHKYQGRALLIATGSCAIHCRYCFRRHFPYSEELAARDGWAPALAALRADPSIDEVLLSGGDPLALSTAKLAQLTAALSDLPQLRRLRLHTRLPVVLPERVDCELLDWLATLPWPVAMVLHANHAQEIDTRVAEACAALRRSGVQLLNQAVLLRGVNDSVEAQAGLSERLFEAGVLPYYLHQLDRVAGAAHFEVGDDEARSLIEQLRRRLPGYLLPRLVREVAGEPYKSPM
ncbi:EF-P beta-lysylation protein EpmB [Pseudomarimonas salicorniae]|uniref:L-lysine 2,3-aminomutase n=1 Tax=Pseudomarimonas salicorniae TaxID=2933270 RepID=A0ABT0GH02_9GAMM|nr:EF-P beta-lysylation protein EpmB [Lysobacter sp. CAU 1642]MCK7593812.1 EF-P beta-lysylation protein EpmB [Lysobacter sp. CAU 1642]